MKHSKQSKRINGKKAGLPPGQPENRMADQTPPFNRQSRIIVALILAVLLAVAGGGWWLCTRSDGIAFLSAKPGAQWIVCPSTPDTVTHNVVPVTAVFRHRFTLDTPPTRASLAVRAFKSAMVAINGHPLTQLKLTGRNWKSVSTADVAGQLRAGTNEIFVSVTNSFGPPALWLRLETDGRIQGTDRRWQVSLAGTPWQAARPASQPLSLRPEEMPQGSEQTIASVKRVWPIMAVLCALAAILVLGAGRLRQWLSKRAADSAADPSAKLIYGLFIIVVIARIALSINNLPQLPRPIGFDSGYHEQYIQFIQEHHKLPQPSAGWEMHQPPLYYLGNALVLQIGGLRVPGNAATLVLRSVNGVIGLIQCWLALLCLRLLFPKSLSAQAVGLLVAAFLPPHLYLSQYVTNETLAGLFVTAAFYFCLRAWRMERVSFRLHAGLGVMLGAAVLTQFSALLAIPVFLVAVGLRLVVRKNYSPRDWLKSMGVMVVLLLLVCAWQQGRLLQFGSSTMPQPELKNSAADWWQYPAFRTSAYYLRFGKALVSPLFSGFYSFGDGIYSTLWGDGLISGKDSLLVRPPWNYNLMNAGYLLAIVVSVLFLIGSVTALYKFIRQPTWEWLVILGMIFLFGLGIFYMSLRIPAYSEVKAFFAFPALVPFSALVAFGWNRVGRRHRAVRTALWIILLVWAMTVYTAFWIRSNNPETWRLRGLYQEYQRNYAGAARCFSQALRLNPDDAATYYCLAMILSRQNRDTEAVQQCREALRIRPDFPGALNFLATLLATSPDAQIRDGPEAVRLAQRACELTRYQRAAMVSTLAAAYAQAGRFDDAITAAQRACDLASGSGDQRLLELNRRKLQFYRAYKAHHETTGKP